MKPESKSQAIRKLLPHPIVDGDGHWIEPIPVLLEYLREICGSRLTDQFLKTWPEESGRGWYNASPARRAAERMPVPPWWTLPGNTLDRATAMLPKLMHERLEEFGLDYSIIYPSMATGGFYLRDAELRSAFSRAYNSMAADLFRPYADRLTPVAVIPTHTPSEAMQELEYAVGARGMKAIAITGNVKRPVAADAQLEPRNRRLYVDSLGLDSAYDYDSFWSKCVELRTAVTTHGGSLGWMDRSSPSNWVFNHMGHFAQANATFARSLFMGGVLQRFPSLNFAFLEGGAGWACALLSDLVGHWTKRNRAAMQANLSPANLDENELLRIFERYADHPRFGGKLPEIVARNLQPMDPSMTSREIAARQQDIDDFRALDLQDAESVRALFCNNLYFGCEADDPITSWAFKRAVNRRDVKVILGSDISHFDVTDMTDILAEAHEALEDELLDPKQFRAFTFGNTVALHGLMNPKFFDGTVVEHEANLELGKVEVQLGRKAHTLSAA